MKYNFEQERKRNTEIREEQQDQKSLSTTEKKNPIVVHAEALFDAASKNPEESKVSRQYHLATIRLLAESSRTESADEIVKLKGWINKEIILPRYRELKGMFPEKLDSKIADIILDELGIEVRGLIAGAERFLAEGDKDQAKACKTAAKLLQKQERKKIQNFISKNK